MNMNPVSATIKAWTSAHAATSQAAINSRVMREMLRWVIMGSMAMACLTVFEIFSFVRAGQVTPVVGTLLGAILTFFGGLLSLAIQSLVTALRAVDTSVPAGPPVIVADDKNA